jgi:hypothetical protein
MSEFKKFPKGGVKKTHHFYGWAIVGVMLSLMGGVALLTGEFHWRSLNLKGNDAYLFGIMLICFGLSFLYYLFFKAERSERSREGFHQLENFNDIIDGHNTNFSIELSSLPSRNTSISVFYYKLEIQFKKKIEIKLNIRRRDRFEYLLWKIGVIRFFDILTGSYHFDSRYRVKTGNKLLLRKIINWKVIKLLEEFDRNYPPIRNKNGILIITDESIRYNEGPYSEDQRLFDPHRGVIENLFKELLKIVIAIEGR